MDIKVQDYPTLRRRGAGIINTDHAGYERAKNARRNAHRLSTVEGEVKVLTQKVDKILELLESLRT